MTLTQAPDVWPALRQKVRKLAYTLRQDGYKSEWAWCVERGKKTGMIHVHALQHGSFIPQGILQERWGAIVWIEQVRSGKASSAYALKGAAERYALKGARTVDTLTEHLALNGGRGVHLSRGYLRGLTTPAVEKLLFPAQEGLTWILVPAGADLPPHLRMHADA